LDGDRVIKIISDFMDMIDNFSINGYPIIDSPVLNGSDIKLD
jgi:hypothetical protein